MSGWLKLHRALSDHHIWNSEKYSVGQAWVDLLMLAQWKPGRILKRGIWVDLEPGQVGWSQESLTKRWKWSRGKVRRFLKSLEETQQIRFDNKKDQKTVQQTVQQTDSRRTANGTVTRRIRKKKKDKKKKGLLLFLICIGS